MKCDKCKKEIVGFFIFKRRFRKDLILCQDCREKRFKKGKKVFFIPFEVKCDKCNRVYKLKNPYGLDWESGDLDCKCGKTIIFNIKDSIPN